MTKSESITRTEMIDKQLASAGWDVKNPTQVVQEFDILVEKVRDAHQPLSPYDGHQFSDYVLLGKDGICWLRSLYKRSNSSVFDQRQKEASS
jgi:type I restriction enzyme R subunit